MLTNVNSSLLWTLFAQPSDVHISEVLQALKSTINRVPYKAEQRQEVRTAIFSELNIFHFDVEIAHGRLHSEPLPMFSVSDYIKINNISPQQICEWKSHRDLTKNGKL